MLEQEQVDPDYILYIDKIPFLTPIPEPADAFEKFDKTLFLYLPVGLVDHG